MNASLPPTICSMSDLTSLLLEVRTYAKWYGQVINASKVNVKFTEPQPELSETTAAMIRDHAKQTPLSPASLDQLISELETIAAQAPTITITLAAPAPAEVKKILVAWCRSNLHPTMLVSLRFNSTILGGMVVRSRSQIYDWSWKRALMSNRDRYAEVLSRV